MKTRVITITVNLPNDFLKMQDWAGTMAQPLERVAQRAVDQYVGRLEDLYRGESPLLDNKED